MALKPAATPLVITLLQGSADAFVQGSVLTGLTGNQAYSLLGVAWEMTTGFPQVNNSELTFGITRRSKTAVALYSDSDVIWKQSWFQSFTTSGLMQNMRSGYWKPEIEIPLVEETIYAYLDSTSTAFSNNVILRLDVEIDTMSPIDRLNLITRSLT